MATPGQQIVNPRTGQTMTFVETRPERLLIDSVNPPTEEREPLHSHPNQLSGCEVVSGRLTFEVEGTLTHLEPGESIEIPAGAMHRFWLEGDENAEARQYFEPALKTAEFFEKLFDLAAKDELREDGMPRLLQLAVLVAAYGDEIRPASPPWPVLRALAAALGPLGKVRGYRATA